MRFIVCVYVCFLWFILSVLQDLKEDLWHRASLPELLGGGELPNESRICPADR